LNSIKDDVSNLIQKFPDVVRPAYENTQGESEYIGGLNTPAGVLSVLTAAATGGTSLVADVAATIAETTGVSSALATTIAASTLASASSAVGASLTGGDVNKSAHCWCYHRWCCC
jgi:citrate synthase